MALRWPLRVVLNTTRVVLRMSGSRSIATTPAALAEEAVQKLKSNPYFDKYASKIAALQRTSPEEFLTRIAEQEKAKKHKSALERGNKVSEAAPQPKAALGLDTPQATKEKKLDDVMKLDLLKDKTPDEIEKIWKMYYKDKDAIAAIIPVEVYKKQKLREQEFPTFLLPLPRDQGYEFIVCQFSGHQCHFTSLINYQAYRENSPECLTLVNYVDVAEDKGIVLMHGEFDKNVINVQEAQCLVNQLQLYYAGDDDKKLNLMHRFTYNPDDFRHMDLIAEMESIRI